MEYSRRLLMVMMVVMCAAGVLANPMFCFGDDFNDGKSMLFDFDGKDNVKIMKYEDISGSLDKPDDSNGYVAVFKKPNALVSGRIKVTKGSSFIFLYSIKINALFDSVVVNVHDVKNSTNNLNQNIKTATSWKELVFEWNFDNAYVEISIECKSSGGDFFFALDQINVIIEEDDSTCSAVTTTTTTSTTTNPDTDSSTSPTSPNPENCDEIEELKEDLEMWKILMIAGWSVAGVAVISTITLAVLLAKKKNEEPDFVNEQWPKRNYPASNYTNDYSTVGSSGIPRLQPKSRRY